MTTIPEHGTSRPLDDSWTPLVKVLSAMITFAPSHVVLQVHTAYDVGCGPYVQTQQEEDGALHAEAVSNKFADPPIGPDAMNTLREMGWNLPNEDVPNFHRRIEANAVRPEDVASLLLRTLRDAYLITPSNEFECGPHDLCDAIVQGEFGSVPILGLRILGTAEG